MFPPRAQDKWQGHSEALVQGSDFTSARVGNRNQSGPRWVHRPWEKGFSWDCSVLPSTQTLRGRLAPWLLPLKLLEASQAPTRWRWPWKRETWGPVEGQASWERRACSGKGHGTPTGTCSAESQQGRAEAG